MRPARRSVRVWLAFGALVATCAAAGTLIRKEQIEDAFLRNTGDTVTGPLRTEGYFEVDVDGADGPLLRVVGDSERGLEWEAATNRLLLIDNGAPRGWFDFDSGALSCDGDVTVGGVLTLLAPGEKVEKRTGCSWSASVPADRSVWHDYAAAKPAVAGATRTWWYDLALAGGDRVEQVDVYVYCANAASRVAATLFLATWAGTATVSTADSGGQTGNLTLQLLPGTQYVGIADSAAQNLYLSLEAYADGSRDAALVREFHVRKTQWKP